MFIAGCFIILSWYIAICYARWLIARHFGQPLRLLGFVDLLDAWDHLRCSQYCFLWRAFLAVWLLAGVCFVTGGWLP